MNKGKRIGQLGDSWTGGRKGGEEGGQVSGADYRVVVGMANMQYALHGKRLIMQGPHCNVDTPSTKPPFPLPYTPSPPCPLLCAYYNTIFFRPSIILCVHENRVCSFFFCFVFCCFWFCFSSIFTAHFYSQTNFLTSN